MTGPRTVLVGVGGYGRVHLRHLLDFHRRGELVLAAAVVFPPEPDTAVLAELAGAGCEVFPSFGALEAALPRLGLGLAVVPTPIHLHAAMTGVLVRAGLDVLVEKPLTARPAEVAEVAAAARSAGRRVVVGFQYLHAPEVRWLRDELAAGAIGRLRRIHVHAAWPRGHDYYTRNQWAGRLRLGTDWVLDSPVNNAMSHFVMVMLYLAGGARRDELAVPVSCRAELYRAQAIESFDTAVIHWATADGTRLEFYGSHSTATASRPTLRIEGETGSAEWIQDGWARVQPAGAPARERPAQPESDTRERMLRALLAQRRGEPAFTCGPELAGEHVRLVAALHAREIIGAVPADRLAGRDDGGRRFTCVPGLDAALATAAARGLSLRDAGADWAGAMSPVELPVPPRPG